MTVALTKGVEALMRMASDEAIMPHYRELSDHHIKAKAADDFVTVADHASEALLSDGLQKLLPEAAIVGEEAAHDKPSITDRLADSLCWIIDPLDGTNNFADGKPPFGVLVALADKGEILAGWILDCLTGRFCHAHKGGGAYRGEKRVHARTTGQNPPIAGISMLFIDSEKREALKRHIAPHYQLVDIPRCAAEQYPRLVFGENDVSIFERTLAWDHAAGVLFLNEAGGKAARPDGSAYRVDEHLRPGLIGAASPQLWEELAERMANL